MLNIKDDEVHGLARRVADATGTTLTGAVKAALLEKLERIEHQRRSEIRARRARVDATLERIWAALGPQMPTRQEIDDDMYDEHGLPR